jgi:hypothetical protein
VAAGKGIYSGQRQAIELVDGVVQQSNFDDFPLARMPATRDTGTRIRSLPVRLANA